MGPRTILIDGYNVIRNTPGLSAAESVSLAHGREVLLAQVRTSYRHTPHRVTVVFDGDGQAESSQPIKGLAFGRVIFTTFDVTADAVIARLTEEATARGEQVTVVSNDFEVRQQAHVAGGAASRASDLASRLGRAPRDIARRGRHRAYVRAQLERETTPEEEAAQRRQGNPKRRKRQSEPPL